jgi:hypothetical protein
MARSTKKKAKKPATKRPAGRRTGSATTGAKARSKSGAETEVEKRWQEYWDCRKRLEEAVARVRTAREALQQAQESEHARRIEFDKVKGTLTTLLDVEPATSMQPGPVRLATDVGHMQPHQSQQPPKQVG